MGGFTLQVLMLNSEFLPIVTVQRNHLTSDATDQEIKTRIAKWLQNAAGWIGGQSEPMKRKEQ